MIDGVRLERGGRRDGEAVGLVVKGDGDWQIDRPIHGAQRDIRGDEGVRTQGLAPLDDRDEIHRDFDVIVPRPGLLHPRADGIGIFHGKAGVERNDEREAGGCRREINPVGELTDPGGMGDEIQGRHKCDALLTRENRRRAEDGLPRRSPVGGALDDSCGECRYPGGHLLVQIQEDHAVRVMPDLPVGRRGGFHFVGAGQRIGGNGAGEILVQIGDSVAVGVARDAGSISRDTGCVAGISRGQAVKDLPPIGHSIPIVILPSRQRHEVGGRGMANRPGPVGVADPVVVNPAADGVRVGKMQDIVAVGRIGRQGADRLPRIFTGELALDLESSLDRSEAERPLQRDLPRGGIHRAGHARWRGEREPGDEVG